MMLIIVLVGYRFIGACSAARSGMASGLSFNGCQLEGWCVTLASELRCQAPWNEV